MNVQKAEKKDIPVLAGLAVKLWPHHTVEEMETDLAELYPKAAFFLAWEGEAPVGFAQCQLRHDYVEGTESSPVGYLEGIYVEEGYRHMGVAKALLTACEGWARDMGCREFASDCELENTDSLRFHLNVGFAEAGRIICFVKKL